MGVIVTKNIGTGSATSSGSPFTETDKLALEMEMAFKTAYASYYKELEYVTTGPLKDSLLDVYIWTDSSKTTLLFSKNFWYDISQNLSKTLLIRDSDNSQLLKTFEYTSGNLTSVTVSAG